MQREFEYLQFSQVGCLIRDNKCLILEDAAHPGRWLLPGGRMDKGEAGSHEQTFQREIYEEIGLKNFNIISIIDIDTWVSGQPCVGVAYLIHNENDPIQLSTEHLSFRWVAENELDHYSFVWRNAKRMIKNAFNFISN